MISNSSTSKHKRPAPSWPALFFVSNKFSHFCACTQACLRELEKPDLSGPALDAACDRMAALIMAHARPPQAVLAQVSAQFSSKGSKSGDADAPPVMLAVRSSANVEDLAGMSAAGLYESKVMSSLDAFQCVFCCMGFAHRVVAVFGGGGCCVQAEAALSL